MKGQQMGKHGSALRAGSKVQWKNNAGRTLTGTILDIRQCAPGGFAPWDTYAEVRTGLKTILNKMVPVRNLRAA